MEKIKQWGLPLVAGIIVGMVLLTFGIGFMAPSTAAKLADEAAEAATTAILVPLCVAEAQRHPDELATMKAGRSFASSGNGAINATGWVPYPENASSAVKRRVGNACARELAQM